MLDENRLLLKEIHHRVKNNLQMVISLLNLQSSFVDNEIALSTIKNSQNRILAMSLIHQKLFMSENVSTINMPIYIRELVEYLKDSFDSKQRINFKLKIEEVELDVTQAVPLGLIINEAITNALKYAFPNNRDGIISITLLSTHQNRYLLAIQDDGIGIPVNSNSENNKSFGINLIKWLSDDLKAHFSIENKNGTLLQLNFEKTILITNKSDQAHSKK
ncbi:sensor histidine kinase [Flavobacterium sp. P21]|uniref:sensor histidine kinase n=1 Tax=Flavobacterium sp. P21 TaxID=3423948 RepID=UPI003D66AF14